MRFLKKWQVDGKMHVVGLVELYACVVALLHWQKKIVGSKTIIFVDNWFAIDVLIKGSANLPEWRDLLFLLEDPRECAPACVWAARVASKCNVADGPSKLLGSKFCGPRASSS